MLLKSLIKVFFYIEEQVDQRMLREKASTAIISVINGTLSAKEIEAEFRRIVVSDVWKWNARQIADGKFTMRFPNSKMVSNYSQFKLGMKTSNV